MDLDEAISQLASVITSHNNGDYSAEFVRECLHVLYESAVDAAIEQLQDVGKE